MPDAAPIRVLVVVKDPIVAIGYRAVLDAADGIACVPPPDGVLDDVSAAAGALRPDVLLLDVALRRSDPQLISRVLEASPETRVMVCVEHGPEECAVQHMLELGGRSRLAPEALSRLDDCCLTSLRQRAHGCMATGMGPESVVRSVRAVATGEVVAAPWIAALARSMALPNGRETDLAPISVRELEVMALLAEGLSNREIAERLGIQEQTVKNHVTRTMEKLGVRNRTEVGILAARHRLRLVDDAVEEEAGGA
ncbi:MAG: DNA-binding response regulator [Gemmatimonadota bacterium]